MARYGPEHKAATRQRLIEVAGRRFKTDGFDGSGIATLVADAGLTNGAFYGHFDSKDALIASVVSQQLAAQTARVAELPVGLESVRAFVEDYLSAVHRDDLANGCPSAALLDEIGRCDEATRRAYTEGAGELVKAIARHLDTGDAHEATARAHGLFSLLVGALQTARALTDREFSDRILSSARIHAMTIATTPFRGATPTDATPTDQDQR